MTATHSTLKVTGDDKTTKERFIRRQNHSILLDGILIPRSYTFITYPGTKQMKSVEAKLIPRDAPSYMIHVVCNDRPTALQLFDWMKSTYDRFNQKYGVLKDFNKAKNLKIFFEKWIIGYEDGKPIKGKNIFRGRYFFSITAAQYTDMINLSFYVHKEQKEIFQMEQEEKERKLAASNKLEAGIRIYNAEQEIELDRRKRREVEERNTRFDQDQKKQLWQKVELTRWEAERALKASTESGINLQDSESKTIEIIKRSENARANAEKVAKKAEAVTLRAQEAIRNRAMDQKHTIKPGITPANTTAAVGRVGVFQVESNSSTSDATTTTTVTSRFSLFQLEVIRTVTSNIDKIVEMVGATPASNNNSTTNSMTTVAKK